ncbi:MAG: urate hydroxylase PuuD [Gammaproteobacteria bacterium]|nr:urate hydroxylase PuuD [Gammaproteobacteria bacterium]
MNPLKTVTGTLVSGLILAIIFTFMLGGGSGINGLQIVVWIHAFVGIIWIGLLYYFNFVQVQAMAAGLADSDGPGPAAIGKYVAPRALLWFRWAALITWLTGASALAQLGGGMQGLINAFMLSDGMAVIGMGAWMGTIMLFNVWVLIWPNQKKVLGIVEATDEAKAKAKVIAGTASRVNTMLSIPMLLGMTAYAHGLPF